MILIAEAALNMECERGFLYFYFSNIKPQKKFMAGLWKSHL